MHYAHHPSVRGVMIVWDSHPLNNLVARSLILIRAAEPRVHLLVLPVVQGARVCVFVVLLLVQPKPI